MLTHPADMTLPPPADAAAEDDTDLDAADLPQSEGQLVEDGTPRPDPAWPIPDYPNLTVPEIIRHTGTMSLDELRGVKTYEKSHRRRKTLLTKLERMLRGPVVPAAAEPPPE